MLKESILFVAATGLLIYFIAPSDEPPEPQPVKEEVQKTAKTSVKTSNDGWDYEEEVDSENFTFGDPTTVLDGGGDDRDEAESSSRSQPSATSPGSRQPGSIFNPITVAPKNLPNPNAR